MVSWGCTATAWLARALNSHPDIFCGHHIGNSWAKLGGAPAVNGLAYLRSQLALFRRHGFQGWGSLDYIDAVSAAAGINPASLTTEQRHALHGIGMLNAIIEERATDARIFRMEDITYAPECFCDLVRELTRGTVACPLAWVESVMSMPRLNRHVSVSSEALGYPVPEFVPRDL